MNLKPSTDTGAIRVTVVKNPSLSKTWIFTVKNGTNASDIVDEISVALGETITAEDIFHEIQPFIKAWLLNPKCKSMVADLSLGQMVIFELLGAE